MAELLTRQQIAANATIHATAPVPAAQTVVDRTFEIPGSLHIATVALYLGFMAVMMIGFGNLELALPMAIIVFTIFAGFALPKIWTGLAPESGQKSKGASRFNFEGVMTGSGRSTARDASVQVLILPVLIFLWGITMVIIAALV